ncbi:hypothetical protein WA026_022421 [Henosepilachna vigintioctopunctata]|uniref:Chemosensory protein n=1 Tax=Henosepilachna vigintioctopunctata TaxID=420089 RepID=A0AAW1UD32_9CUCU
MNYIHIHVLLTIVFAYEASAFPKENQVVETYSSKYDNVDVDAILASTRLLRNYVNCLLDKISCTPEGQFLKQHLSDALATECSKCSQKQKKIVGKLLAYLLQYHKDYWNQLLEKYDKDGTYRRKYEGVAEGEEQDYSDLDQARRK